MKMCDETHGKMIACVHSTSAGLSVHLWFTLITVTDWFQQAGGWVLRLSLHDWSAQSMCRQQASQYLWPLTFSIYLTLTSTCHMTHAAASPHDLVQSNTAAPAFFPFVTRQGEGGHKVPRVAVAETCHLCIYCHPVDVLHLHLLSSLWQEWIPD